MQFEINGKEIKLKFGLKFCRELDKVYRVDYQGLEFGMGVNMAFTNLQQKNPTALADVLKAASSHKDYSLDAIDDAIEKFADENGDLSLLFDGLLDEMGKSPVIVHTINHLKAVSQNA